MATHLRWKPLNGTFASGLPIQVTLMACTPSGETDTEVEGEVSVVACKALIEDDFSSKTIYPWSIDRTVSQIADGPLCEIVQKSTDSGFPQSSLCLSMKGGVGDAKMDRNWAKGCRRTLPSLQPTRVSFLVQTNTTQHETAVLFLTDANDRVCTVFAMRKGGCMGIEDELIRYHGNLTTDFEAKRWYQIELLFDWEAKTFAFVVENSVVGTHIPFEDANVSSLGHMYISNSYERSETLWDHVECSEEGPQHSALLFNTPPVLKEGAWKGYVTLESPEDQCFLRATLHVREKEPETPLQRRRSRPRTSRRSEEASALHSITEAWTDFNLDAERNVSEGGGNVLRGRSQTFDVSAKDSAAVSRCNVMGLTKDLLGVLDCEETSDFCFVLENGRRLHVHKWLLCARSPHFKSMLLSGMKEAQEGSVQLPDVDYKAFRAVCEYLYGGDVHLEPSLALHVLELTDRYFITELKRLCETILLKEVTLETVVPFLEASERFSAAQLLQGCVHFIIQNFSQVINTPEYQALDSRLMLLIQRELAPLISPSEPADPGPEDKPRAHRMRTTL